MVAGHVFGISLPEELSSQDLLKPYEPFETASQSSPLFTLRLQKVEQLRNVVSGKPLKCLNDEAPYFWIFEEEDGTYSFAFSYTKAHPDCLLKLSAASDEGVVYISERNSERLAEFAISNAVMLMYTFCTAQYDTMMVHASVIANNEGGYMFLGKSGTGKSTHSRLWLNHIAGSELLNDDNPVIRVIDNKAIVYGTPWSGKTPCYRNVCYPLAAITRLQQAPHNSYRQLTDIEAFTAIAPSCAVITQNIALYNNLCDRLVWVSENIVVSLLHCLPCKEAATTALVGISESRNQK